MNYVKLYKSKRRQPHGTRALKAPIADEQIHVTVAVRPASSEQMRQKAINELAANLPQNRHHLDLTEFTKLHGAMDEDLALVKRFADENGLRVVQIKKQNRCVVLKGSISEFNRAFNINLKMFTHAGSEYRSHSEDIQIPANLKGIVQGVLGLENRNLMEHHTFVAKQDAVHHVRPAEVMKAYNFPTDVNGEGQRIALIELGGGFHQTDITEYFRTNQIPTPKINVIEIDGQRNNPASANSINKVLELMGISDDRKKAISTMDPSELAHAMWTIESTLDIQLAGAFANASEIHVYFAPNNAQGKYHALTSALTNTKHQPTIISCSWGAVEEDLPLDVVHILNQVLQDAALRGITVCFSTGDKGDDPGRNGKPRAHFPATSPYVLSCGGTHWITRPRKINEVVWNEALPKYVVQSGGGVSTVFKEPDWQATAKVKLKTEKRGRGVPDVSAKADIESGYSMRIAGQDITMGGTSAAAPMWAGLIARMNQKLGCRIGYLTPLLYQKNFSESFTDITKGRNGTHFKAGPGWDPCTGWGTPNGKKLFAALKGK